MAEDTSEERKHLPSGKRLEDLRKQGQSMRSRDLASGLVFLAGIGAVMMMSSQLNNHFRHNFIYTYSHIHELIQQADFPGNFLRQMALSNLVMVLPIFLAVLVAAFFSPFVFGGWNFSLEAVQFKFDKLNPVNYFKRLFSLTLIMDSVRSLLKVIFIMTVLLYFSFMEKRQIRELININPKTAIVSGFHIAEQFIVVVSVTLVFIIIFDVLYHYYEFMKKAKMTTQEMKEESKDVDGNPEMKRKIRSKQYSLARQRLSVSVPQATVVVTNPTHYAIALRYDETKDNAPKILAMGKDYIATQIRQLAVANAVPIYEAPPLARAIYHTGNIGSEVHPALYMSVAIVLSYVSQLQNYQRGVGQLPLPVSDLKIPDDFVYSE